MTLATLGLTLALSAAPAPAPATGPATPAPLSAGGSGERAAVPDFTLQDLKGQEVSLSGLRGKVVVISFWATWCKPCKQELDDLNRLYKAKKGEGLEVLAIATDGPDTASGIRSIAKRKKWKFPVVPDGEGKASSLINPRGTVPYTVYVDREGRLAYDHEGYSTGDLPKVQAHIEELLGEPAR